MLTGGLFHDLLRSRFLKFAMTEVVMVNDTLCNLTHYTNMFTHTHIVVISSTTSMSEVIKESGYTPFI